MGEVGREFMLSNVLKSVPERTRDKEISRHRGCGPSSATYDPRLSGITNLHSLTLVPSFVKQPASWDCQPMKPNIKALQKNFKLYVLIQQIFT